MLNLNKSLDQYYEDCCHAIKELQIYEELLTDQSFVKIISQLNLQKDVDNLNIEQTQTIQISDQVEYLNQTLTESSFIQVSSQVDNQQNSDQCFLELSQKFYEINVKLQKLNNCIRSLSIPQIQKAKLVQPLKEKYDLLQLGKGLIQVFGDLLRSNFNIMQFICQQNQILTLQRNEPYLPTLNNENEETNEYVDPLPFEIKEQEQHLDFGLEIQLNKFVNNLLIQCSLFDRIDHQENEDYNPPLSSCDSLVQQTQLKTEQ